MTSITSSSLLYDRVLRLEITPPGSQSILTYGNLVPGDAGLRINFGVERTLENNSDKAKIAVFNMSPGNRDGLVKNTKVVLTAGYRAKYGVLFVGFVDKVKSTQQGPDIATEIEASDSGLNITYAVAKRVYSSRVTLAQVLQDLASDLGLQIDGQVLNVAPGIIKGIPNVSFARGGTYEGPVAKWLDLLLKRHKIDWSIQNGRLLLCPRNTPTSVQPCVVLSGSTGMINTPSFSEKGLVVDSVLNSEILPGRLLQVVSKNTQTSGFFKALACKYEGDTHDQNWHVESQCEAVTGSIQTSPLATANDFQKAVI